VAISNGYRERYDPATGMYSPTESKKYYPTELTLAFGIGW